MPGSMDGLELAHAVATGWPDVKIIIVSGKHRPQDQELPVGAMFIPKPFGIDNMQNLIRRRVA